MKAILLIMIGLSILNADFTKNGDIVTDNVTGLQWQDDAVVSETTWQGAIDRCEALTLGIYSDWRLPNINELISLVDDTRFDPSIDTSIFDHTISGGYWSSTSRAGYSSSAWLIGFSGGGQNGNGKSHNFYVRCVRAGQ